jgi:CheY-like chemotaxis protein
VQRLPPRFPLTDNASRYAQDSQRRFEVGMNDFLATPIDLNRLKARRAKWLGKANQIGL